MASTVNMRIRSGRLVPGVVPARAAGSTPGSCGTRVHPGHAARLTAPAGSPATRARSHRRQPGRASARRQRHRLPVSHGEQSHPIRNPHSPGTGRRRGDGPPALPRRSGVPDGHRQALPTSLYEGHAGVLLATGRPRAAEAHPRMGARRPRRRPQRHRRPPRSSPSCSRGSPTCRRAPASAAPSARS